MRPSRDVGLRLGSTVCCWLCQAVLPKMHPPPLRAVASLGAGNWAVAVFPLSFPGVVAADASHVLAFHTPAFCLPHLSCMDSIVPPTQLPAVPITWAEPIPMQGRMWLRAVAWEAARSSRTRAVVRVQAGGGQAERLAGVLTYWG